MLSRTVGPVTFVLALAVCLVLLLPARVHAATFTVTRIDDPQPDGCLASDCSLREAIIAANANPGADVILLGAGMYQLELPLPENDIENDTDEVADLDIRDDLEIRGVGPQATVIDGQVQGGGCLGGILEIHGAQAVVVTDLALDDGCAANSFGEYGGNLRSTDTGAHVTLSRLIVRNGYADNAGGGVYVAASLHVAESLFHDNFSEAFGDAIGGGTVILENSTVTNHPDDALWVGTIHIGVGELTVISSTITGNGYGIDLQETTAHLENSIIVGNEFRDCAFLDDAADEIVSLGYNIDSDGTCHLDETGDLPNTSLVLGTLQDNGGPTSTYALPAGSPALDRVPTANCLDAESNPLEIDQRGVTRPQGAACDVGAYERTVESPPGGSDPVARDDCKDSGWREYGFRNQGQCIGFVNTGRDER